jgi:hypothetical protein
VIRRAASRPLCDADIVDDDRRIIQDARRTLAHARATREAVALQRRPPEGGLTEVVCAFCRKSASEGEVREGEKLVHLDWPRSTTKVQ